MIPSVPGRTRVKVKFRDDIAIFWNPYLVLEWTIFEFKYFDPPFATGEVFAYSQVELLQFFEDNMPTDGRPRRYLGAYWNLWLHLTDEELEMYEEYLE